MFDIKLETLLEPPNQFGKKPDFSYIVIYRRCYYNKESLIDLSQLSITISDELRYI